MSEVEQVIASVEDFIDKLPEPLRSMGQDFTKNGFSCRDAFIKNDMAFPGLHIPFWLAERYSRPQIDVTREIVRATLFGYLYIRIQDDVYDFKKGNNASWLLVANEFINECYTIYHRLFPPESSFWNYFRSAWLSFSKATAWEIVECRGKLNPLNDEELSIVGEKLSFAKVPVAAVLLKAGQGQDIPIAFKIVDLLATSSQLLNDFGSIDHDLETGHFTYPLSNALDKDGDDLFENLLRKNSVESLFDKVNQLDRDTLILLEGFKLPQLSDFLKRRILSVEDMKRQFLTIKLKALMLQN